MVHIFTLSMVAQLVKEQTPGIAIMDPFYMSWSTMQEGPDRVIVTTYIEDFFSANKQKEIILMPYFAK